MPELPEVETTVRDLRKKVLGRAFVDIWTDFEKMIKKPGDFKEFKKELIGRKIEKIWRRGKNILFGLSGHKTLLLHQKLTGHLLLGKWRRKDDEWLAPTGPLLEKINAYIHLMFFLDNGQMLALSDLRKFAKIELWETKELEMELDSLGPEPLDENFSFEKFKDAVLKTRGKIKQVLMNQNIIAGIGNIYSDEILWQAKVNPLREIKRLRDEEIKEIYEAMKKVLKKAIELGGESISDYRRISGEMGFFDKERKVYQREGEKCSRCGNSIKRIKLVGRSAHYCPRCQKL